MGDEAVSPLGEAMRAIGDFLRELAQQDIRGQPVLHVTYTRQRATELLAMIASGIASNRQRLAMDIPPHIAAVMRKAGIDVPDPEDT